MKVFLTYRLQGFKASAGSKIPEIYLMFNRNASDWSAEIWIENLFSWNQSSGVFETWKLSYGNSERKDQWIKYIATSKQQGPVIMIERGVTGSEKGDGLQWAMCICVYS